MARLTRETHRDRVARLSMQGLAVAIPLLLLVHGPAHAESEGASACEPTHGTPLDRRLVAKADENVGALRRYVTRTQPIYQLDMTTAVQRVERQREADTACMATVASR